VRQGINMKVKDKIEVRNKSNLEADSLLRKLLAGIAASCCISTTNWWIVFGFVIIVVYSTKKELNRYLIGR